MITFVERGQEGDGEVACVPVVPRPNIPLGLGMGVEVLFDAPGCTPKMPERPAPNRRWDINLIARWKHGGYCERMTRALSRRTAFALGPGAAALPLVGPRPGCAPGLWLWGAAGRFGSGLGSHRGMRHRNGSPGRRPVLYPPDPPSQRPDPGRRVGDAADFGRLGDDARLPAHCRRGDGFLALRRRRCL